MCLKKDLETSCIAPFGGVPACPRFIGALPCNLFSPRSLLTLKKGFSVQSGLKYLLQWVSASVVRTSVLTINPDFLLNLIKSNTNFKIMKVYYFILALFLLSLTACKKDKHINGPGTPQQQQLPPITTE